MGSHPNSITSSRASRLGRTFGHCGCTAPVWQALAKGVAWPRRSAVDEIPPSNAGRLEEGCAVLGGPAIEFGAEVRGTAPQESYRSQASSVGGRCSTISAPLLSKPSSCTVSQAASRS